MSSESTILVVEDLEMILYKKSEHEYKKYFLFAYWF